MAFTLPKTITPGTNENASDVQANDAALRDEFNGVTQTATLKAGSMDPAFAKDNVEPAFERYKELGFAFATLATFASAPLAATGYLARIDGSLVAAPFTSSVGLVIRYLDPADYNSGSRTTKYRLYAESLTNATAPGISVTLGLFPITAVVGTANQLTPTVGGAVSGSTVTFTTPAANTPLKTDSGDFTAPAAGRYALGLTATGSQAANSAWQLSARLQVRQV